MLQSVESLETLSLTPPCGHPTNIPQTGLSHVIGLFWCHSWRSRLLGWKEESRDGPAYQDSGCGRTDDDRDGCGVVFLGEEVAHFVATGPTQPAETLLVRLSRKLPPLQP